MITAARLRELFHYDENTGTFTTKVRRGRIMPGTLSGFLNTADYGYRRLKIGIDGREYMVHRLAWLYVYGAWPQYGIDHIDGDAMNNRISNLREASQQQNVYNAKKPVTNKSGFKGVSWHAVGKKWQAHVKSNGINRYLGLFSTPELAHEAYKAAATQHNGEFARFS